MAAPLDQLAALLARWRIPAAAASIAAAGHGTNNHTRFVTLGSDRWVLRISQNLSAGQVAAEHRLLARLREAGLPFAVPEPVATCDGSAMVLTPAGPATLCRWIAGEPPDLSTETALTRLGRAIGQLGEAMWQVPPRDAPHDWRRDPLLVHPAVPDVGDLCADLRAAGASIALTDALACAADGAVRWWREVRSELPCRVVHGDLARSNILVDPATGQVTGLLDFEIAGADFAIVDLAVALLQSGALTGPDWQRLAPALLRGYQQAGPAGRAELQAVPGVLARGLVGSVLWRAGRWRRGQAQLSEVTDRLERLTETTSWLTAIGPQLLAVLGVR